MGLFDVFKKKPETRELTVPGVTRGPSPFEALRPQATPKGPSPFSVFQPAARETTRPLEDVFVPREERSSREVDPFSLIEQSPPERPVFVAPTRRAPLPRQEFEFERFVRELPSIFNLESLFRDVEATRSASWFRNALADVPHTGDPATIPLGEVARGDDEADAVSRLFEIPGGDLDDETLGTFLDAVTAGFQALQPPELPGWFALSWDGRALNLDYYEVPVGFGMRGIFDAFKKKKENLPALPSQNLPAPLNPFELLREEKKLPAKPSGIFSVFQPKEKPEAQLPAQVDPKDPFLTAFRKEEAPRSIEEAIVPEAEYGSRFEQTELFPKGKEEEELPRQAPTGPEVEAPREIVRDGKRYYLPLSVRQVADRFLELYDPGEIEDVILKEREKPWFQHELHYLALYGEPESATGDYPRIELEHFSIHEGPSEVELVSEIFNIPMDLLMSYIGDERDEGWDDLMEEILRPLYWEIVPEAWRLILPNLPGYILIGASEDGCPAMVYEEVLPEGTKTSEAKLREFETEM